MATHHITAVEAYCHEQAGTISDGSSRWLLVNLLDELSTGHLAHRPLAGRLESLDDILDHHFWVIGLMKDVEDDEVQAFYQPFSTATADVPEAFRRVLRRAIMSRRGHPSDYEQAGDVIALLGRHTIAALSVGKGPSGELTTVLYWHPYFTSDIAIGLLRETVQRGEAPE